MDGNGWMARRWEWFRQGFDTASLVNHLLNLTALEWVVTSGKNG